MSSNKNTIVTCALPYANGSIHLGHMLEHIQADIYVRFQKIVIRYLCGITIQREANTKVLILDFIQKDYRMM